MDESRRLSIQNAVLADLGGVDELSEVRRQLAADFAAACVLRDLAYSHVAAVGPFTQHGKKRAAVDLYLAASSRAERLGAQIGLDRRARKADTLEDYLSRRADIEVEAEIAP